MHDQVARIVSGIFSGDALKGAAISGIVAIGGWFWHSSVTSHDQDHVLNLHTQQIAELASVSKDTQMSVNQLVVTTTRTEGKLDTINQKIDDDRAARAHR